MVADHAEESFKITDRRRRAESEDSPRAASTPPRPAGSAEPGPRPAMADAERSLVGLFMMLGSSALMALGEAEDPRTGQRQPDLSGAADIIDLLLLLREKTEGHRSREETQVIEELLYDLQLRYVNATKQSG